MDTAQLKKFAQEARKSLMGTVEAKLGVVLAEDSLARRESKSAVSALEGLINEIGKDQVIEKVAYTWFNRFCALRFMDANHYNKIGIVSPVEGQTQPEILAEAKMGYYDDSVVDAKNKEQINKLLNTSQDDAYKLLLVSYCNFLNKQLPFMFERINDYTELLMPDDLLSTNSVLSQTVAVLDKETCKDVEVIGWLYQYYISEKKDEVFADLKKGKKISKENVPAATQIFTPKWIVKYMVENSVGKLWLESHPDSNLQSKFKYYLKSAEQDDDVKQKLEELKNKNLKPQDIKVLDPACGSGHILVVAFSVLFEIYKSQGWQENEIPEMILKNNLFGLDICDRAAQLSQFVVMMKAREYDRNIFNKVSELNICSIKDTNWLDNLVAQELMKGVSDENHAKEQIKLLQDTFKDAKEYGSIIDVRDFDFDFWNERINYFNQVGQMSMYTPIIKGRLRYSIKQAKIMQQKYECVISNPPYMGAGGMGAKLSSFVKSKFPNTKSDMSTVFMEKALQFANVSGYMAMINIPVWMFLSSYEKLRTNIIENNTIINMLHFGRGIFGSDFGTTSFVINKSHISGYVGKYQKLFRRQGAVDSLEVKEKWFFEKNNIYNIKQDEFKKIQGMPIAYWASDKIRDIFENENPLISYAQPRQGMATSDNERFLRFWYEVNIKKVGFNFSNREEAQESKLKWFPYNKGGEYRKWFRCNDYLVNWENDGQEIKEYREYKNSTLSSNMGVAGLPFIFKENISWSKVTAGGLSLRYIPKGFLFDVSGCCIFANIDLKYLLGLMNSKIISHLIQMLSPTVNFEAGQLATLPIIFTQNVKLKETINTIVNNNIELSKDDWDSFETSWDFKIHPLLKHRSNFSTGLANEMKPMWFDKMQNGELREADWTPNDGIAECFNRWQEEKEKQFKKLKDNEEELNRLFIEIYGLQDEMDNKVDDKDITVALADEKREIKSLLSYAVGCMFGRYSLDKEGLVFAGGEFNKNNYKSFEADDDGIIPILSEHYFSDDITERFKKFLKVAFGETHYEENMDYIATVLGKKTNETADDTIRNYFLKDFYNDHVKLYQKRPIYWLFSSKNGNFNALIYLHRYNKDTVNRILNNYLREYEGKLEQSINNNKHILTSGASDRDKSKAQKEIETAQKIVSEVKDYERDIIYPLATERKEIDLDDGVKVNYLKFGKALKNIGLKA